MWVMNATSTILSRTSFTPARMLRKGERCNKSRPFITLSSLSVTNALQLDGEKSPYPCELRGQGPSIAALARDTNFDLSAF